MKDEGIERRIQQETRAQAKQIVAVHHDLHRHPELAFHEERTARVVATHLRALGLDVRTGIGGTGVTTTIVGRANGPTVALRADMDALPITEQTALPYCSTVPGAMHACGHDGHTAILIGVAAVLVTLGEALPGSVKLIFQPAEEPVSGAQELCAAGVLSSPEVKAIVALHGWPGLPLGAIDATPGPQMASADTFTITLTGRGGHGAMPHLTVDPIVVGAQVVSALQCIASRAVSPLAPVVVSVTSFQAGEAYNVIPEEAYLRGTVRTLDPALRATIPEHLRRVAEGTAAAYGATAALEYRESCPVMVNDAGVAAAIREAAVPMLGAASVRDDGEPSMGAEDFSLYLERVPGALLRLGLGDTAPLHNPRFDFPDAAIPIGIELLCRVALRLLQ